ncbi:MAG: glycerate dehydrogenase, partial [Clostridia bacterium]|nr:glycerate dehydrogenase [Clostridia bacterium]
MKKAYIIMNKEAFAQIYSKEELRRIRKLVELDENILIPDENGYLKDVPSDGQIILSGWGGPRIDGRFLELMKDLEAVFYGAGSIRGIVTDE